MYRLYSIISDFLHKSAFFIAQRGNHSILLIASGATGCTMRNIQADNPLNKTLHAGYFKKPVLELFHSAKVN